jgi:hypothetical protein
VTITKQKQQALPSETINYLIEGKKYFVGQVGLLGETSVIYQEKSLRKTTIGLHQGDYIAEQEEARVLTHPEVVKAFDKAATAIEAWENSL